MDMERREVWRVLACEECAEVLLPGDRAVICAGLVFCCTACAEAYQLDTSYSTGQGVLQ